MQLGVVRRAAVLIPGTHFFEPTATLTIPYFICTLPHRHRRLWCDAREEKALAHIFERPLCI